MRFSGFTDEEDYHWITLLWCIWYGRWQSWMDLSDWRLRWVYGWYDGPHWTLIVGPFWVSLSA